LEYAEITDTASEELIETYCRYDGVARLHLDARTRSNKLFLQQINRPGATPEMLENLKRTYLKNDADQAAERRNCTDQQGKIATALTARRLTAPQCDATGPK